VSFVLFVVIFLSGYNLLFLSKKMTLPVSSGRKDFFLEESGF